MMKTIIAKTPAHIAALQQAAKAGDQKAICELESLYFRGVTHNAIVIGNRLAELDSGKITQEDFMQSMRHQAYVGAGLSLEASFSNAEAALMPIKKRKTPHYEVSI